MVEKYIFAYDLAIKITSIVIGLKVLALIFGCKL